jgi:hypothetical protein
VNWLQLAQDVGQWEIFLRSHFSKIPEDISFNLYLHNWFQHYCAPTHYNHQVRQWLSENYPRRRIGRGREPLVPWSTRSPDFNPLYCFL